MPTQTPVLRDIPRLKLKLICTGRPCAVSDNNLFYSALMYFSYFVLFARLKALLKEDIFILGLLTKGHHLPIPGSSIKPISASQKGKAWKKGRLASLNSAEVRSALEVYFRPVVKRTIIHKIKDQPKKKVQKTQLYRPKKKKR